MDLNTIAFLKDGKYRLKTLNLLNLHPMLPSELALELNINRASMSRVLRDLKKKELVKTSDSSSRTALYSLTETGISILKEMEK